VYELKYPHLFSPIRLGKTVFRNRIFGSPTGYQELTCEEFPPAEAVAYYARKAMGGAASVAVGEMLVELRGKGGPNHIPMFNQEAIGALTSLAEGIARYGAVPVAELQHAGMYAQAAQELGCQIYGPVDVADMHGELVHAEGEGTHVLAMTEEVIEELVEAYADAALFAKTCGFGMVLIHGGHGWLLSQFLSPFVNTRTDRWGGKSLENRMRLPLAIVERIRAKCGPKFPIEFRMSVSEANPKGYGIDEGVQIAKALDGKVDLIHCSAGHHEVRDAFVVTHPSMFLPDGTNAYLAKEVKKYVETPVATVGAFTEPELMEELIAKGEVDVIEAARQLICDPDMPIKAREGRTDEIVRCMRCLTCFSNLITNRHFCCALNPEIGQELDVQTIAPPKKQKKVLVAGGGVAGMQAALTANERGHKVILCEKSDRLGGALLCEENVPFKDKLSLYLAQQAKRVADAGVEIRLNTPVTRELAQEIAPDTIIAALGARPLVPGIPGIDGANVKSAEEVYEDPSLAKDSVVILGGGLVGTELGIHLAGMGRKVTILEMLPELSHGGNILHAIAIDVKIRELGIDLNLSTKALEITDKGVTGEHEDGTKELFEADTVIYAVGQRPLWEEADALRDCAPEYHLIGDALAPKNIRAATKAAFFAAENIGRV